MTNYERKIKGLYPYWGNDVSSYQGKISAPLFMQVQKPKFLIVRMSCGAYMDSQCLNTLRAFDGLCDLHVYSALLPGTSALTQFEVILDAWKQVKNYVNGRLWLDIEKDGLYTVLGAMLGGTVEFGKLDDNVGHEVGLYTNYNFFNVYQMAKDTRMNWRQFWIANYGDENGKTGLYPFPVDGPHFWQYSSRLGGYPAGCGSAALDGDVFYLEPYRYEETLTAEKTEPPPPPEPELPAYVRTVYSRVNLRGAPEITPETDVATTDSLGVQLPVIEKTDDGKWYRVGLYIHQSCVDEVK